MKFDPANFGDNLKEILDENELSQAEFCRRAGLAQSQVTLYIQKRRYPNLRAVVKTLSVLPVSFERLVGNREHSQKNC